MLTTIANLNLKREDKIYLCENYSGYDTNKIVFSLIRYDFSCIGIRSEIKNRAYLYAKHNYFQYKKKIELDKNYSFIPVYKDIQTTINEAIIDANKIMNAALLEFEKRLLSVKSKPGYFQIKKRLRLIAEAEFFIYLYDVHPLVKIGTEPIEKQQFKFFRDGKIQNTYSELETNVAG